MIQMPFVVSRCFLGLEFLRQFPELKVIWHNFGDDTQFLLDTLEVFC